MLDQNHLLDYYLALLSVQMAVLGFVIAGIVALIQIINAAKPRRDTRLLIRHRDLFSYMAFLTVVLFGLAAAAWATGFNVPGMADFFARTAVGGVLLAASLGGLLWFVYLTYKARRLLEAEQYLTEYIKRVPPQRVRNYLFRIYSARPEPFEPDADQADPAERARQSKLKKQRDREIAGWEQRYARYKNLVDPFQPIREYLKDNAFNYYDSGTARGLHFFSQLYDKTFAAVAKNPEPEEYYYLARYAAENAQEFFAIFRKTSSEKRRADTIRFASARGRQFVDNTISQGLLTTVRALEDIAKAADDDEEIMLCLEHIQLLTDAYLQKHQGDDWQTVATIFEQICLSVTRLAEDYYLQRESQLKTLPVSSQMEGEYRTVTSALVGFFTRYRQLADRYIDTYPVQYFEAIEALLEALLPRYADIVQGGRATRGLNRQYQVLVQQLYAIYIEFGRDAIQNRKPDLLSLSLSYARRIIKPAKELGLPYEREQLTLAMVELGLRGTAALGDIAIKPDGRTISQYVVETLQKHAGKQLAEAALTQAVKQPGIDLRMGAVRPLVKGLRGLGASH